MTGTKAAIHWIQAIREGPPEEEPESEDLRYDAIRPRDQAVHWRGAHHALPWFLGPVFPARRCAVLTSYAAAWGDAYDKDTQRRHSREEELRFWCEHAAAYDERCGSEPHSMESWAVLRGLIPPGASVLDVGCGTGRFAIPLALQGCRVTGFDQSPAMLAIARGKAAAAAVDVELQHRTWPAELEETYDVALAAWSLYRQRDIRTALAALIRAARDRVVLIDSVGLPSCHPGCVQNRAVELAGCLAELGCAPNLTAVHEATAVPPRAVGVVWADLAHRYPVSHPLPQSDLDERGTQ